MFKTADKLILPGVGAFDQGMRNLEDRGPIDLRNDNVLMQKTPILGICLGVQTNRSEEGELPRLGWIDADTIRFDSSKLCPHDRIAKHGLVRRHRHASQPPVRRHATGATLLLCPFVPRAVPQRDERDSAGQPRLAIHGWRREGQYRRRPIPSRKEPQIRRTTNPIT